MKKLNAMYVAVAALVLALVALVMCIMCCSNKGGSDVEATLKEKPELVVQALQNYEQKQRDEAMAAVQKKIAESAEELNNHKGDGIIGNPDGKLVLVEFFDFSCGYCHRLYPAIKNIVAKNPDVKVVAKPMTFMSPISGYAAKAALAAQQQGKFGEVYMGLFEAKDRLTEEKVDEIVTNAGADLAKVKEAMNSKEVEDLLKSVSELANKLQVRGVPTLVFNNKILQTLDEAVIQEAIDAAK